MVEERPSYDPGQKKEDKIKREIALARKDDVGIWEKIKLCLKNSPGLFEVVRSEKISRSLLYLLLVSLIPMIVILVALLTFGVGLLSMLPGLSQIIGLLGTLALVGIIIGWFLYVIIGSFIAAAISHIFVWLVGGREGYKATYKVVVYSLTPSYLFFWVPILNVAAGFWSIYIYIRGISVLHRISMGRAFLAWFLPVIIVVILMIVGAWLWFASMASSLGL